MNEQINHLETWRLVLGCIASGLVGLLIGLLIGILLCGKILDSAIEAVDDSYRKHIKEFPGTDK